MTTPPRPSLSDRSDQSGSSARLLLPHGGYGKLRSFRVAQAVYDATVLFCNRFVDPRSRTRDQMVQAARSGVQNIAEGSMASATSKKTELKLTGVARASLEELHLDYQDFLRQRHLPLWPKDSPQALAVRRHYQSEPSDRSDKSDPGGLAAVSPETAANTIICLINQATYLLRRQLLALEQQFLREGGFTERLHAVRSAERARSDWSDSSDKSDSSCTPASRPPACPRCGQAMMQRTARKGPRAGQRSWGCSGYPDCTGTRPA